MAPGGPGTTGDTSLGKVLTDAKGLTLYTYDKDEPGKSNCTGLCAVAWPPVTAPEGASATAGFTVIERGSGTRQWAYKGRPLYTYVFDMSPGDVKGDGDDGVWHVAKP
jgi:predicted lipoprotein with Yx(FWY)xxD motif